MAYLLKYTRISLQLNTYRVYYSSSRIAGLHHFWLQIIIRF